MAGKWDNIFSLLFGLIGAFPVVDALFGVSTQTSMFLLGVILLFVVLGFISVYLLNYFRGQSAKLNAVEERIKKAEEQINYMEKLGSMDKRIALLEAGHEHKSKKGIVDPRLVILVVLLVLLYLYLRTIGIVG